MPARVGTAPLCAMVALAAVVAGACTGTGEVHADEAVVSRASAACGSGRGLRVVAPAPGRTYLGAFPDLGGTEDRVSVDRIRRFERLSGRGLAWVYVSNNWGGAIRFPAAAVRRIRASGSTPFIRMMPRSSFDEPGGPDPRWSMQSILSGRHDRALRAWGRSASQVPGPLLVEFGTEVDGSWFPWNGSWNGGATSTRYGNPRWPDGPERFRDAYRHVVRTVRAAGARNVTWVFHVDAAPDPDPSTAAGAWNAARWYWPGEAYVDWIGLSAYGPQVDAATVEPDEPFDEVFASGYRTATRLSRRRPIALLEFAVAQGDGRDEAAWTRAAFAALESGRYPRVRGVAWWHERWTNEDGSVSDLRIDSDRAQLTAYRAAVADRRYVTRVRTTCD